MSEKRKRQTTVMCTNEVWASFQAVAVESGKTLAVLLGEVVEHHVAPASWNEQVTLPEGVEDGTTRIDGSGLPPRTPIGSGPPVVRIR
jgi:hypothetical protein